MSTETMNRRGSSLLTETRPIFSPKQVLSKEEIKPGKVYIERSGIVGPDPNLATRYGKEITIVGGPFQNDTGWWVAIRYQAGERIIKTTTSLADRGVTPYSGKNLWHSYHWLEDPTKGTPQEE